MTSEAITALFARREEALARRDSVALAAAFADHCVLESPGYGTLTGRAAVERVYREFFTTFPDIRFDSGTPLITGDQVVQTITVSGTDTGGFLGQAPTGKPFRVFLVQLFSLDDEEIVHERRVYDVGGLMLQLATDRGSNIASGIPPEAAQLYRAALETARQEHELKIAAEIQRALLPEARHMGIGFEVVAASVPCRAIGGDFFDYFNLSSGVFAFALGDVAGKGPPAALMAAVLQGIFAGHAESGCTPAETLAHVNQALIRRTVQSRFATVLYAALSCDGELTYCNAGHNPPLLVGRRGLRRLDKGGLILGVFEGATFEEETLRLEPGDVLIVFSDGITEALNPNGEEFGEERLLSCVEANRKLAPEALLESLVGTVRQFTAGAVQSDDLTLLVLSYVGAKTIAA